ncbi:hypothetical protein IHV10_20485 [Fictibacillus sp. 5RED26]|uniref:hypothetical protein n=1 Tax=unclassified Fictibacillus TaxID=2644029 RepID=UPI0018CFE42D|nr:MULTISPECIES: hypothetical protein [unclassified Fictibacillus]MBH0158766.1 hypothetical protein [Fictibacillus sp. 5RED26]MBH0167284.1 hypothetical protein [Fictibacillus sp. 7GRE50]
MHSNQLVSEVKEKTVKKNFTKRPVHTKVLSDFDPSQDARVPRASSFSKQSIVNSTA